MTRALNLRRGPARGRRWQAVLRCALALVAAAIAAPASAEWPDRTITIVSPYPAGGTNDVVARLFADRLRDKLGRPVIVDPRAGVGGVVGSTYVAAAAPDGYTLLSTNSAAQILQPLINSQAKYDPITGFTPIARYGVFYMTLAVRPDLGPKTVRELVDMAKARPGQLNYGTAGVGSIGHFATALLASLTGTEMTHVPYRGSAPALQDMLGGRVDLMIDPAVLPYRDRLRVLMTSAPIRQASHPDVPTAEEAGLPGFNLSAWYGLTGPPGLPQEIVDKLAKAVAEVAREQNVIDVAANSGVVIDPLSGPAFSAVIRNDVEQYRSVRDAAGIAQIN